MSRQFFIQRHRLRNGELIPIRALKTFVTNMNSLKGSVGMLGMVGIR